MISNLSAGPGSAVSVAPSSDTCIGLRITTGSTAASCSVMPAASDRFDKYLAAPVPPGHFPDFPAADPHRGIINPHPRQRRHAMLDGLDQ